MNEEKRTPLVLIVEDSKSALQQLQRRIVDGLGFRVLTAATYRDAVDIIAERGEELFLAVLDLHLPDASDGEVVDFALEHEVPSIVFTSSVSQATRKRILSKPIVDYVVKNRRAFDEVVYTIDRLHKNQGVKVMVVDDSRSVRAHVRALLEINMFQVIEASSGEEALELAAANEDLQLVITDYEMAGMNGVELTSTLRSRYDRERLAIIGISSRTDSSLTAQFLKQGADDFLDKPFEKEEFACRVTHNVETIERQKRLRELDDLKNRFLGMAAHDLRNPIGAIRGFAGLLLEDDRKPLAPDQKEMLSYIHMAAGQMSDLVSDLLDITVIESGKLEINMERDDLDELVRQRVRGMHIPAERKEIAVEVRNEENATCLMDRKRIAQVVDNLLSNALKFSPGNTTVTISLRRVSGGVELSVRDQGPGISEEERKRLFGFFQRLSNRPTAGETSTGLGLAICRKIVDAHGGAIRAEEAEGGGTVFFVTLPA